MAYVLTVPVVDLDYRRGDSRAVIFVLKSKETGLPLDLTSYTLPVLSVATIPNPPDLTTEIFKVTGVIDPDPTTGRISFAPTTTQSDITPNVYFYDAQVIDPSSGKLTFVRGKFRLSQDIVKD